MNETYSAGADGMIIGAVVGAVILFLSLFCTEKPPKE